MARDRKRAQSPERSARRFRIRPAYIVLLLVMVFFTFKFVEKTQELRQLSQEAQALRVANQQVLKDSNRTRDAIKYYRTPAYIEQRARSIWGYTRPGDVAIMVNPRFQRAAPVHAALKAYTAPQPTWRQWWSSFFP